MGTLDKIPLAVLRFPGGTSGAGLFVAWRAVAAAGQPAGQFALHFCGRFGHLHPITVANPWSLALSTSKGLAATLKAPPQHLEDQEYEFVFITHPSLDVAKKLVERLNAGESVNGAGGSQKFPIEKIRPTLEKGNRIIELPTKSDKFVPKGHADFDGWVLYRHMPHAGLSDVGKAVKKLAFMMGELRFPTDVVKSIPPYPQSEGAHYGTFDQVLQAATHTFVDAVKAGVAFQLSAEGKAAIGPGQTEKETWGFLLGTQVKGVKRQTLAQPAAAELESGVVDEQFVLELLAWKKAGLRRDGALSVAKSIGKTTLFAQPELWLRYRALVLTMKALGVPYNLGLSNTSRSLGSIGPGQVMTSFHKIGRALDFDSFLADPSPGLPVAFEGNWPSSKDLRWQVYAHSVLDPLKETPELANPLAEARKALKDEFTAILGEDLPALVTTYLTTVEQFHTKLEGLATSGTLGADYFRESVRRFQFQAGQPDGGDFMPAVTASSDAALNGVKGTIASWVNLSRVAFGLGLRGIGAHTGKLGVKTPTNFRDLVPGAAQGGAKAIAADELAEGIRVAGELSLATVSVTPPGGKTVEVPVSDFDTDAVGSWLRRATDSTAAQPKAVTFAAKGVDMTIEWPVAKGADRTAIESFLDDRAAIKILVVRVGPGLAFGTEVIDEGEQISVGDAKAALLKATASGAKADRQVTVRPVYSKTFPEGDPGTFTYKIPAMNAPQELEWWHYELQPDVDTLSWHEYAADWGLDATVLAADAIPSKDGVPPATPWTGGAGVARTKFPTRRGTEPTNASGTESTP